MARRDSKNSRPSVFSDDDIASFSNKQSQTPVEAQTVTEDRLGGMGGARKGTVIDSRSLQRMMQEGSAEQKRFSMDKRLRNTLLLLIAFVVVYLACLILPDHIVNAVASQSTLSFVEVLQTNLELLAQVLSGQAPAGLEYSSIVIMALVALVGAGLASIGASYQVTFRNDLATPSSLGVMSGAALGSAFYYLKSSGDASQIYGRIAVTQEQADALSTGAQADPLTIYLHFIEGAFYAMAGAFIVVALTVIISKIAGHGKLNNAVLIIAGQVFASIANAFIVLFRLYLESTGGQSAVSSFAMAQIGDLTGIGRTFDLLFMGLPILVAMIILFLLAPQMNAIALSGDDAKVLGLKVDLVRGLVIALSTVITAVIVAFVGSIGFVGFAIPQMVRRIVGPDFRYLLPASALAGASFLLIVNFIYSSFTFTSTGIGVVTSLFGGLVFIVTIIQRRKVAANVVE